MQAWGEVDMGMRGMAIVREMDEAGYHAITDLILDRLMEGLEAAEDAREDLEADSSGDGVINVKIEGKGQWVINKQTPSRQIWLSSPITGPMHYRRVEVGANDGSFQGWVCTKDEHRFVDRVREQLGVDLLQ